MLNWFKTHTRATLAILGLTLIAIGLIIELGAPAVLITIGTLLVVSILFSYIGD